MNFQNQVDYLQTIYQSDMFDGASFPEPLVKDDAISAIMQRCGLLEPQYSEPAIMHQLVSLWFRTNQWNFQHLVNIILAEYSPIENTDRYSDHSIENDGSGTRTLTRTSGNTETHGGTDARTITDGGSDAVSETHGGTDSRIINKETSREDEERHTGTDARTEGHSGTDTTEATTSAYNSSAYQPADKTEATHGEQITDNLQHGEIINGSGSGTDDTTDALTHGETVDTETTYGKTTSDNLQHGETITSNGTGSETVSDSNQGSQTYTEHTHGNIGVTTNQELINQELQLLMRFNVYDWIAAKFEKDLMIQIY